MLLDPRYKNHLLPIEEKFRAVETLSETISDIQNDDNINSQQENVSNNIQDLRESGTMKSKLADFVNKTLGNPVEDNDNFESLKSREIQMYFSENLTPRNMKIIQ